MAVTSRGEYLLLVFAVGVMHTLASGKTVWEGEPAILRCDGQNVVQNQEILWQKLENGTWQIVIAVLTGGTANVTSGERKQEKIKVDSDGSLRIAAVSYPRDNGTYKGRCGDKIVHRKLQVYQKVKALILTGTQLPVPENTEVSFTCEADSGNPPPNITWEIPGPSVQPGPTIAEFSSHVTLTATRDMSSQVIRCRATQGEFTMETNKSLEVMREQVFVDGGSQITQKSLFLAGCGILLMMMTGMGVCYKLCKSRLGLMGNGRAGNEPQREDEQVEETAVCVVQGSAHESDIRLRTSGSMPTSLRPTEERALSRLYPMIPQQATAMPRPMADSRGCTTGPRMPVSRNQRAMY